MHEEPGTAGSAIRGSRRPRPARAAVKLAALACVCLAVAASVDEGRVLAGESGIEDRRPGRIIVLPGIRNTRFHLVDFTERVAARWPGFEVEIRTWGRPLVGIHNLRAYERNTETAAAFASEIAEWRRAHPDEPLYLVGYSGGGGMAALIVAALPEGVAIDRLVLVAPAVSPDFDVGDRLMPHVSEFVVNYSSVKDLQVGLGTLVFGTIDRVDTASAGAVGFASDHEKLAEWFWTPGKRALGHRGNHLSYLGRRWQNADLLPALDPRHSKDDLVAHWAAAAEAGE